MASLYDEFGNYIGPELGSDDDGSGDEAPRFPSHHVRFVSIMRWDVSCWI